MASLQKKGNSWYGQFYWQNRRFTFGIGRLTETQATKASEIVELLERVVLRLPDGMGVADIVKHDGHPPAPAESQKFSQKSSLGDLRDGYLRAHEEAQEAKTLYTARIHLNHLERFTVGLRSRSPPHPGPLPVGARATAWHSGRGLTAWPRHPPSPSPQRGEGARRADEGVPIRLGRAQPNCKAL